MFWGVSRQSTSAHELVAASKCFNHKMSSISARVELMFRVLKRKFGYTTVRYKGSAKSEARVVILIGSTKLYLARVKFADLAREVVCNFQKGVSRVRKGRKIGHKTRLRGRFVKKFGLTPLSRHIGRDLFRASLALPGNTDLR